MSSPPSVLSFALKDYGELETSLRLKPGQGLSLRFRFVNDKKPVTNAIVHWGVTSVNEPRIWQEPTKSLAALSLLEWPASTTLVPGAAETILVSEEASSPMTGTSTIPDKNCDSSSRVAEFFFEGASGATPIHKVPRTIEFVLHFDDQWVKRGKDNFSVPIGDYLRSAFNEQLFSESIDLLFGDRLARVPESLRTQHSWTFTAHGLRSTLLGSCFSDDPEHAVVFFLTDSPHPLLLHWGLADSAKGDWMAADSRLMHHPQSAATPESRFLSHPVDAKALQTEFAFVSTSGETSIQFLRLVLDAAIIRPFLKFVLKETKANVWYKDGANDFVFALSENPSYKTRQQAYKDDLEKARKREEQQERLRVSEWERCLELFRKGRDERKAEGSVTYKWVQLSDKAGELDISASFNPEDSVVEVVITGCIKHPAILHWGTLGEAGERKKSTAHEWRCPDRSIWPPGTNVINKLRSCETPLQPIPAKDTPNLFGFLQTLSLTIPAKQEAPRSEVDIGVVPVVAGLAFVLRQADGPGWFKAADQSDINVRLTSSAVKGWDGPHGDLIETIIESETGWNHMTLMHRFGLVNDAITRWNAEHSALPRKIIVYPWRNDAQKQDFPVWGAGQGAPCAGTKSPAVKKETFNDEEFWSWIFVWCRFSSLRYLDWQRNYNTKPRELAHVTECLTVKLSSLWLRWPQYRSLIRLTLGTIPRGGSQGQAIRDRILEIMHRHKIPEHSANFYEQWHQKLHNNTTPDDIIICTAIIRFLRSGGELSEFWDTLKQHGIGKERLLSYERKIVAEPYLVHCDVATLISDFEQYLDILVDVHDSLDLKKAFDYASRHLPAGDLDVIRAAVFAGQDSPTDPDAAQVYARFCKIAAARECLVERLLQCNESNVEAARQLLFLDISLEQQQNLILQAGSCSASSIKELASEITHMLVGYSGHSITDELLHAIVRDWLELGPKCATDASATPAESALMLKALTDRVALYVGDTVEKFYRWFDAKALFLGQAVGTDQQAVNTFVEGVLRGTLLFATSISLKRIEPLLRKAAKLPPWQMISYAPKVRGRLQRVAKFQNIQARVFDVPTILLTGAVSGEEEIPAGVQAVLVRSGAECPDILSHVCVRARNANVFFAVCFDDSIVAQQLDVLDGKWVEISATEGGQVNVTEMNCEAIDETFFLRKESRRLMSVFDRKLTSGMLEELVNQSKRECQMDFETTSKEWCISSKKFDATLVGSKALNLRRLQEKLPNIYVIPNAVSLPYGVLQKVLNHPLNAVTVLPSLQKCLTPLKSTIANSAARDIFNEAQSLLLGQMQCPEDLWADVRKKMADEKTGLRPLHELLDLNGTSRSWKAICQVYASMFSLRPWISLSKANRDFNELNMAVLIQELLDAQYAFVLHSRNPFGTSDEMYGEVVCGLGEALVGNYPGRALSWTLSRDNKLKIISQPSKHFALKGAPSLIFRSDSNGEDLEGFAGAGLFESIPAIENTQYAVHYSKVRLVADREYRDKMLREIGKMAFDIETAFSCPMDIEGVVLGDDKLAVVQARPQV